MRKRRIRRDSQPSYYHLIARTAGCRSDRPFGPREKQHLVDLILKLSQLYTVEILSYAVMSNHVHIVCHSSDALPSTAETLRRFRFAYPDKAPLEIGTPEFERFQKRLRNISEFMKDLQMRFTFWYNRTRPEKRSGRLWGDRFKSVLLQGQGCSALWSCVKYVELNAVRAGIVQDPAEYPFSSWGRHCRTGRHPFRHHLIRHARQVLGTILRGRPDTAVFAELGSELARIVAGESGADSAEILAAQQAARKSPEGWVRADRRIRFWSDGAAVGDQMFVQKCYADFIDGSRSRTHRYGRGSGGNDILYAVRRLQKDA